MKYCKRIYSGKRCFLYLINKNGLDKVLLSYLTYRYNYDRKFQGAKYDEKGNPTNKDAELRQKFEGQKPEDIIDGLFENWKLNNSTSINENIIKIFKQIIYMLSNYTYSKYAINKGYNDDVKLIAPHYFELLSIPETDKKYENYLKFKKCIIELNSLYFNFSGGPAPPLPLNYWEEVYTDGKPFNEVDNKYYFVVWRGAQWYITKFLNNEKINQHGKKVLKKEYGYEIGLYCYSNFKYEVDLFNYEPSKMTNWPWRIDKGTYFKSVYRWEIKGEPNIPSIDPTTGQIIEWNFKTSE